MRNAVKSKMSLEIEQQISKPSEKNSNQKRRKQITRSCTEAVVSIFEKL
jgi:hypothetical protein